MEKIVYKDKIFYYPNVIDNTNQIIDTIEKMTTTPADSPFLSPWKDWKTVQKNISYSFGAQRVFHPENRELDNNTEIIALYDKLMSIFIGVGKEYCDFMRWEFVDPGNMIVAKYYPGKAMGAHVDSYDSMFNSNSKVQTNFAMMSAILYLNDDYEGGDLRFPNHDLTLKPKAGSMVVFPSTHPFIHESLKITSGYKYIVPLFWVNNENTKK